MAFTLDRLPEAVLVFDAEIRLAQWNRRAEVYLGELTAGASLGEVLALRDEFGDPCATDGLVSETTPRRLAESIVRVHARGRTRPYALSGQQDDDGLVLTLRSAAKRQALEAASSELIAIVSHEIRSPLTSVKGFTSTMLRRWERFSDEQKRTMLETINHDADRVTRLLKDLLAVSRIDAGRVEVNRERMDVVATMQGIAERLAYREDARERDVVVTVDGEVAKAWVDPDKMEQVFTNLVENALRYAPESAIRIDVGQDDRGVRVCVADDGPGISAEMQRRIFDKFGRGKSSRRAGTGLGLYISKGMVEANGGTIEVESSPGNGATFRLWVPTSDVAT